MPYFERDRRLEIGERVNIGVGPKKAEVEVWGNNLALVSAPTNDVFLGKHDKKTGKFIPSLVRIIGRAIVEKESISSNKLRGEIAWRKK